MLQKYILLALIVFWLTDQVAAQKTTDKRDSAKVYRSIEEFSKKRKITKYIYNLFLLPVGPIAQRKTKIIKKPINKPYRNFEGKIIRNINITTLDPFGYSVNDTAAVPPNFFYKAGNSMHIKTLQVTIKNLLMIHKNTPFDSLLVKESARLIRTQKYIHEVKFTVRPTANGSDSVDIFIRVSDEWSILANGGISSTNYSIDLEDKNFLGLGHDFQNNFNAENATGRSNFKTNYFIPNFRNTYVSTTLHYEKDLLDNSSKFISLDRPFFSAFAKWAGGLSVGQMYRRDQLKLADSILLPETFRVNTQDLWIGHASRIFKGNTENERTTNLTVATRYARTRYEDRPPEMYDTLKLFENEDLYLGSIGISTRKYVQDKYIFSYGITEDVPVGMVYSLTGGYRTRNNSGQIYLGAKASFGNYNRWGYLSTNMEYGTFVQSMGVLQGVFSGGFNYFTELFDVGGVKFRQFIKPQFVLGINRVPNENININNENGIKGFNSPTLFGTQKALLSFQSQFYLPWKVLGFRFGPYFVCNLGMLGNDATGFKKSSVYSQFGFGFLIQNEYLVLSTFQVSIAFYPTIPGTGDNVFKFDPEKASDFGFRDFNLGKPAVVAFQ